MTNHHIIEVIRTLARAERAVTIELLHYLVLGERRRVYLEVSHSSMFAWMTKDLGFSSSAAQRRLEAARLINKVPSAITRFQDGRLNLTNIARAQTVIAAAERRRGQMLTIEEQEATLALLEGKSTLEAERVLAARYPDAIAPGGHDSIRVLDAQNVRLSVTCPVEITDLLERARNVLSHRLPSATTGEILVNSVAGFVNVKNSAAAADGCVIKSWAKKRKALLHRANHQCEHVDPRTGTRCPSRFRLEIDHIIPKAKGGSDDIKNLRVLCRAHNARAAEEEFGREKMNKYRRKT